MWKRVSLALLLHKFNGHSIVDQTSSQYMHSQSHALLGACLFFHLRQEITRHYSTSKMHQRRMIKFDVRSNNVNEIIFWELIFLTTDDERDVEYVNAQY